MEQNQTISNGSPDWPNSPANTSFKRIQKSKSQTAIMMQHRPVDDDSSLSTNENHTTSSLSTNHRNKIQESLLVIPPPPPPPPSSPLLTSSPAWSSSQTNSSASLSKSSSFRSQRGILHRKRNISKSNQIMGAKERSTINSLTRHASKEPNGDSNNVPRPSSILIQNVSKFSTSSISLYGASHRSLSTISGTNTRDFSSRNIIEEDQADSIYPGAYHQVSTYDNIQSNDATRNEESSVLVEASLVEDNANNCRVLVRMNSASDESSMWPDERNRADGTIVTATKESWLRRINPCWFVAMTILVVGVIGFFVYIFLVTVRSPDSTTLCTKARFLIQFVLDRLPMMDPSTTYQIYRDIQSPQHQAMQWVIANAPPSLFVGGNSTSRLLEMFALATLYFSTGGDKGFWLDDSGWLSPSIAICEWNFVGCTGSFPDFGDGGSKTTDQSIAIQSTDEDMLHDGIRHVDLSDMNLTGTIPPEIALLESLVKLDLSMNPGLTGSIIPSTIGGLSSTLRVLSLANLDGLDRQEIPFGDISKLTNLQSLNMSSSRRVGELKENCFEKMDSLAVLDLSGNALTGALPSTIGGLTLLTYLNLKDNSLGGEIPRQLGDFLPSLQFLDISRNRFHGRLRVLFSVRLRMLRYLDIGQNAFSGTIPTSIKVLSNLEVFRMSGNAAMTSFKIPTEIGQLTRLKYLELSRINLEGSLPSIIGNIAQLETLILVQNKMTGTIPEQMFRMESLAHLMLGMNDFTGSIPSTIMNLRTLDLSSNRLEGHIPSALFQVSRRNDGSNSSLTVLNLNGNKLRGTIPTEIGQCQQLELLDLGRNMINGNIPSEIGNLGQLSSLGLALNELEGTMPREVGQLTRLESLNIKENFLEGSFPSLKALDNLARLDITLNEFTGTFPMDLFELPRISQLDCGNVRFSGTISSLIGKATNLLGINIENNKLSGSLPTDIGRLTRLRRFDGSLNNFVGSIPSEIGLLKELYSLDLGYNDFIGTLPSEISRLQGLHTFRLRRNNNITGIVPSSICGFHVPSLPVVDCGTIECECCGCPTEQASPPTSAPTSIEPINIDVFDNAPPSPPSLENRLFPSNTGSSPCHVDLRLECPECDSTLNSAPEAKCAEIPFTLVFRYTDGSCNQSDNNLVPSLYECSDNSNSTVNGRSVAMSFIVAMDEHSGEIYHFGFVERNGKYVVRNRSGQGSLGSKVNITIYSSPRMAPENIVQTVVFSTSCERGLQLGDSFGAHQLIEMENEEGVLSLYRYLLFKVTLANKGKSEASLAGLKTIDSEGQIKNLMELVGINQLYPQQPVELEIRANVPRLGNITQEVAATVVSDEGLTCNISETFLIDLMQ